MSLDPMLKEYQEYEHAKVLSHRQVRFLSELQVEVRILLGSIQITGEQLLDLTSGSALECGFELGADVQLLVGDELLAEGKLVRDDGQLFVEIAQLAEGK